MRKAQKSKNTICRPMIWGRILACVRSTVKKKKKKALIAERNVVCLY